MDRVVLDPATIERLQGVERETPLCDPTGRVVGRFMPEEVYLRFHAEIDWNKPLDPAVKRQAMEDYKNGLCLTTEELLAELRELREFLEARKERRTQAAEVKRRDREGRP